jgi:hypothetical protein
MMIGLKDQFEVVKPLEQQKVFSPVKRAGGSYNDLLQQQHYTSQQMIGPPPGFEHYQPVPPKLRQSFSYQSQPYYQNSPSDPFYPP